MQTLHTAGYIMACCLLQFDAEHPDRTGPVRLIALRQPLLWCLLYAGVQGEHGRHVPDLF